MRFLSAPSYTLHAHLRNLTSLPLPCSTRRAWSNSTSVKLSKGGTRSSDGPTADVRRTRGRGEEDGLLRTVRVERMGGFANRVIVRLFVIPGQETSTSVDVGLQAGGSSAVGGYRDMNVRTSAIERSTFPVLNKSMSVAVTILKKERLTIDEPS